VRKITRSAREERMASSDTQRWPPARFHSPGRVVELSHETRGGLSHFGFSVSLLDASRPISISRRNRFAPSLFASGVAPYLRVQLD
jgi:hypothetical protein